jgi:hypothetical protein
MTAEPVVARVINDVIADRTDNRRLSAGIRACRTRANDFLTPMQMQLAGIAMSPETRGMLTRALNRYWEPRSLTIGYGADDSDRDLVIGAGYTAATYAASRVAAGHAPPIVLERGAADNIGGAFAVSGDADVFRLNSRTRPGLPGLPDQDKALNYIPGAPLQPAMVTSEEYMGNGLMAWLIRLTLAMNADVYADVNVTKLLAGERGRLMTVVTNRGDLRVKRVLDARGSGQQAPASGNIFTFEQFMRHMGGPFPLRGMKQIAVIGGGNSGLCAVESALGVAPNNTSAIGLDYVDRVDLYATTIDGSTCDTFRDYSRGRYIRVAQYLEGNVSNPTTRLKVMNELGYASQMPNGVLVNGRTYDMAVLCTGLVLPPLNDALGYGPLAQSGSGGGAVLAAKARPFEAYRIGPAARIEFSQAEVNAGITGIPAVKDAMFRTGPRTAALATMLNLGATAMPPRMNYHRVTFQMRPVNGQHYVYLIRAGGAEIPRDQQQPVYGPETAWRAQIISDALNRGMLTRIMTQLARLLAP